MHLSRSWQPARHRRAASRHDAARRAADQAVPDLRAEPFSSLTHGSADDPCRTDEQDRLLIEAADALHDSADIGEDLWRRLARLFREEQLLDLLMLAGWYHAISFTANAARVAPEESAPHFADAVSAPWPETDAGQLAGVRRPGASGGVGHYVTELAAGAGAEVTAVTGSGE